MFGFAINKQNFSMRIKNKMIGKMLQISPVDAAIVLISSRSTDSNSMRGMWDVF